VRPSLREDNRGGDPPDPAGEGTGRGGGRATPVRSRCGAGHLPGSGGWAR
jgi:hypothetical protein